MRKPSQPFAPSKMIFAVLLVLSLALFQNCSNLGVTPVSPATAESGSASAPASHP